MGNNDVKEYSLNKYVDAFNNFHKFIEGFHSNSNNENQINEGFLVNLEDYNNIINYINDTQEKLKNIKNKGGCSNSLNPINLKKLTTENFNNVKLNIINDYRYKIINNDIYNIICDKKQRNSNKITYRIIPGNKLIIYSEEGQPEIFINNRNNIIDKSAIIEKNENLNIKNYNLINNSMNNNTVFPSVLDFHLSLILN